MTIIRTFHNKENPYVQLNKEALWDEKLSLKAVGLWARCMSRPSDWIFYVSEIASNTKEGAKAIYSAINELIEHGYALKFQRKCKNDGTKKGGNRLLFGAVEYVFFEFKITEDEKNQYLEKFKKSLGNDENPLAQNGDAQSGDAQNGTLLNKDITKKEEELKKERERATPPPIPNFYENKFENKIKISPENHQRLIKKFGSEKVEAYVEKLYRWSFSNVKKFKEKTRHDMVIEDWIEKDSEATQPSKTSSINVEELKKKLDKFSYISVSSEKIVFTNPTSGHILEEIYLRDPEFRQKLLSRMKRMGLPIEGL